MSDDEIRRAEEVGPLTAARFPGALFDLGQIGASPGAVELLEAHEVDPLALLARHVTGDGGDLDPQDRAENELALGRELRIFSVYKVAAGATVWIITEADRSSTTILRPSDY